MAQAKRGDRRDWDAGRILLTVLAVAGWLALVTAACLLGLAKPEPDTYYDRIYYTTPRQAWNMDLVRPAGPVLLAGLGCTVVGIGVYLVGLGQKKYRFPFSLALTGLLSAALYAYIDRTLGL